MQNCRSFAEKPNPASSRPDTAADDDDDDEPGEDMDAYVESGRLEAEDNVTIHLLVFFVDFQSAVSLPLIRFIAS